MIELKAGQNTPLRADVLRFGVRSDAALDISALVVGEDLRVSGASDHVHHGNPATGGVELAGAEVVITTSVLRSEAKAVLLVASTGGATLGPLTALLSENGVVTAEFAIVPAAGEAAMICLEVYRRGAEWKVRAVGQGYAGGLPVLLPAHGVDAAGAQPASHAPHPVGDRDAIPQADPVGGPAPLEVAHGLERLWMVFEDAARSAAALESARDYAGKRLDEELSAAVSDPATRNTPGAEAKRQEAQRRHDELIAVAESNHRRDSEQLIRELAESDRLLPPALASWSSPAWDGPPKPSDGIRLGELYALDRGPLRIPYTVPVPLTRPLWIDTEHSAAVVPVVGALLARLLAADPGRPARIDVIDLSGAFAGLLAPLAGSMNGAPVTDHADISPRLQALVDAVDMAEMAYSGGSFVPPAEHRVLLAADFPHGYSSLDAQRISALTLRGDLIGLSMVIVGSDESASPDSTVAALSQACRHLPTVQDTPLFDPWTGSPWHLELDLLPRDPQHVARLLRPGT
ncbi:TerD family protein [Nocardia puris]|uniref:Stress response protein SCP2 n=1 Tax=Nocardia puris TaxID=208602 RepID=A0A366DN50_9NOCA|nr:TerD family protein [Nocardia puris]RBO91527.1 stress response protein SCP2 [Nocardia puris]